MVTRFPDSFVRSIQQSLHALAMSARIVFADVHPSGGSERVSQIVAFTRHLLGAVWGGLRKECKLRRPVFHCGYHHSGTHRRFGSCANVAVHRCEAKHASFRQVCRFLFSCVCVGVLYPPLSSPLSLLPTVRSNYPLCPPVPPIPHHPPHSL
jgi:hypothetical protein